MTFYDGSDRPQPGKPEEPASEPMWQGAAFEIERPQRQTLPLVVASPHSGDRYPDDLLAASRLDAQELRRSEDFLVQRLAADAPALGAPLIAALFPRAYVDVNREPYELDPALFDEPLPAYANSRSPRVAAGLGTVARVVASGREIYSRPLPVAEALQRVERCYVPYHRALAALVAETQARFGFCILLDCHSMPTLREPFDQGAAGVRADVVLGDGHGSTAAPGVVQRATEALAAEGLQVAHNVPYAGGFVTRHYGRPEAGVHGLQIEIARRLYMDEARLEALPDFARMRARLAGVMAALGRWRPDATALPRAAE